MFKLSIPDKSFLHIYVKLYKKQELKWILEKIDKKFCPKNFAVLILLLLLEKNIMIFCPDITDLSCIMYNIL